jgi:hypothetical protein
MSISSSRTTLRSKSGSVLPMYFPYWHASCFAIFGTFFPFLQALSQEYFMMTEAIQNVPLYNEENKELSSADTERNQPIH